MFIEYTYLTIFVYLLYIQTKIDVESDLEINIYFNAVNAITMYADIESIIDCCTPSKACIAHYCDSQLKL